MRANDTKSGGASTVLLSIVAVGLAGMVGTIGLIHQVAELGPKVGDIVAFDPMDRMSRDMRARIAAIPADDTPGIACVLDVRAMHAGGGSIIIEAHQPRPTFAYRVHWSGQQSSNDGADCGRSADLMINLEDVETLAMAAGGYGVPDSKHLGNNWRVAGVAE
jgi:hypothetical protein